MSGKTVKIATVRNADTKDIIWQVDVMNEGWIKLYRKLLDWEWYDDPYTKAVFIDLLLCANYQDKTWHGKLIERGALVTSVNSLANRNGLSVQNVRTALKHLTETGVISKQTTNKNTIIIVLNYSVYQDFAGVEETISNSQITNNQQTTNNNIISKESNKEINNITNLLTCEKSNFDWSQYDEEEMTEYYPGTVLTIAEYDKLYMLVNEYALNDYCKKIERYTDCKEPFKTILEWAIKDGNLKNNDIFN